jgi:hypothetical protein
VDCYVVATGKKYIINDLAASGLESIGCAGRGGHNLHCMEVADKMLTTFGLWVKITDFAGWLRLKYSFENFCG